MLTKEQIREHLNDMETGELAVLYYSMFKANDCDYNLDRTDYINHLTERLAG